MVTRSKLIFAAVVLTLTIVQAASAQEVDRAKLDQFFDRLAEKNKAMGSLLITRDGKPVYVRTIGYGKITPEERVPLTPSSRFRIGSITKMFTAAMTLQLVDEGRLKLTDKLDKFFPQVPNAPKITIGQILEHRSGIHDAIIDPRLRKTPRNEPVSKEQLLELVASGSPDFEPGERYLYSNSGYFLLGLIIEKVTGKTYGENLKKRINAKAGLMDTYMATGPIDPRLNEALTYRYIGEWKPERETHPSNLFGGGAIISTPADLARFIAALFDGKLISRRGLDLMRTMRDGEGAGMSSFKFAGKTFYGHTGGADNYGAWLAYLPEERLAVAYTTNAKVHPVGEIMTGVVDIYYNRPFQVPTFEPLAVSVEVLDRYVGVYSTTEGPVKFTITRKDKTLFAQPGQESPAPLEATAQNIFKIDGTGGVQFEFDAAAGTMIVRRAGGQRIFTRDK